MSVNLLDLLKGQLSNSVVDQIGGLIGESGSNTQSAVSKMLPSILGGMASKANSKGGAQEIFDALSSGGFDGGMLDNLSGLLGGGEKTNAMMDRGSSLTKMLLGNKLGGVLDILGRVTGFGNRSSSSLMSILVPIVMSMIGRQRKKSNLDVNGVKDLLMSQGPYIKDHAPAGIFDSLGLGSILGGLGAAGAAGAGAVKSVAGGVGNAGKKVVGGVGNAGKSVAGGVSNAGGRVAGGVKDVASTGSRGWLKWLIMGLLGLFLLGFFGLRTGCGAVDGAANKVSNTTTNAVSKTADVAKKGAGAVGNAAGNVVDGTKNAAGKVAEGTKNVVGGAAGAVGNAAGAVGNAAKGAVGKLGELFSFDKAKFLGAKLGSSFLLDKVQFATGSATLKPESKAQLDEIAQILKENKTVAIELQGHTDNTGNAAKNTTLSQARAESAKAYLVGKGVAANRLTAKGYGSSQARASNDTPQGRQKNRRTEMKITRK